MHKKDAHPLITGTIIGFFYRIFLSQTIGAEGIGIYQLITPISVICFSIAAAGIQSGISRYVAAATVKSGLKSACRYLIFGLFISITASVFISAVLYINADYIAESVLHETRCCILLRLLSFTIPLESIHACINGFCFGMKSTKLPAISQLVEQVTRVLLVFSVYSITSIRSNEFLLSVIIIGTIVGEVFSVIICVFFLIRIVADSVRLESVHICIRYSSGFLHEVAELIKFSIPLTANRTVISLLCSIEAIYIPLRLQLYGYSSSDALSIYGILTGMALPLILFPSALTNSAAVMLLPIVSESDTAGNRRYLFKTIRRTAISCISIGCLCGIAFLVFGQFMGIFLFHNLLAGSFITTLSFICPFLYLNTALASILHGLGKSTPAFLISLLSISIRLGFTYFLISYIGIRGFLYGLLVSQIVSAALYFRFLSYIGYPLISFHTILKLKKRD